jgi:hypothetical protein
MGSRAGLDAVKKKSCQPPARRYTDYCENKNIVKKANSQYGCHTARIYFSSILFNMTKSLKNADATEI